MKNNDCDFGQSCQRGVCVNEVLCGNSFIDYGEACDGINLGGETCVSQGFDSGILSCSTDCLSLNTSYCQHNTCANEFDTNCDSHICMEEVVFALGEWISGHTSIGKMGETLNYWKGSGC